MKTLIIGLGNVGTIHGWALSQAGADISHVVRKGTKGKFENGVRMDVLDLRGVSSKNYQAVYMPKLMDEVSPDDGYELVMVATPIICRLSEMYASTATWRRMHSSLCSPLTGRAPMSSISCCHALVTCGVFQSRAARVERTVYCMPTYRRATV